MATIGNILVRIGLVDDVSGGINKAVRNMRAASRDIESVGRSFTVGFSLPVIAAGTAAVKTAADYDALRRGLEAVTGSAAEAARQMADLREVAKLPGLGFKEAVQGAVNLEAIGFSADRARQILLQFGNALATVGRGREDLDEVIRQLGQLANRGKVTADNLKPIIERVPQAARIIKQEFGTIDTEALQKLGISSEEFIDRLIKGLAKLPRTTGGIANEFENLRDSINQALADAGEALVPFAQSVIRQFGRATSSVSDFSKQFKSLPQDVQDAAVKIAAALVAIPIGTAVVGKLIGGWATFVAFLSKYVIPAIVAIGTRSAAAIAALTGGMAGASIAAQALSGALIFTVTIIGLEKLYELIQAVIALRAAKREEADSDKARLDAATRAAISIRQQGGDIRQLTADFHSGKISLEEYEAGLRKAALAVGKLAAAAKEIPKPAPPPSSEDIAKAFSSLGLKDVKKEAAEAQAAFALLRRAGVLAGGQLEAAYQAVKEKLKAVQQAALSIRDAFRTTPIALAVPDARDFGRSFEAARDQLADLENATKSLGLIRGIAEVNSRALFDMAAGAEAANRQLAIMGTLSEVDLNKRLHLQEAIDGFHELNVTSTAELNELRDKAQQAFDAINTSSTSTFTDRLKALAQLKEREIAVYVDLRENQAGQERKATDEKIQELERWFHNNRDILNRITADHGRKSREATEFWRRMGRQVSTILTDLSRDIVDALFPKSTAATKDVEAIAALGIAAGVSGDQLNALADTVQGLATATGSDFRSVATAAGEMFRVFQVGAADQIPTLEFLFKVIKQTGIGTADLLQGLSEGAPVFRALGLGVDDAAAFLGKLNKAGFDVDLVMKNLGDTLKALTEQGFARPGEALQQLIDKIRNAGSESEATSIAVAHFGADAQEMVRIIRAGGLEFDNLSGSIDKAGDSISDAAAKTKDLEESQWKLKAIFADVWRATLRAGIEEGIGALVKFIGHSQTLKSLWEGIKSIFTAVGQAIGLIGKSTETLDAISNAAKASQAIGLAGGAASAAGEVAGSAGSAAGGIAGAAGGAAGGLGSAVGGVTGAINLATGIISAGAGVASAIGTFRLEGTMNQVERNTAAASIHLYNILQGANQYWPVLNDIKTAIYQTRDALFDPVALKLDAMLAVLRTPQLALATPAASGGAASPTRAGGDTFNINVDAGGEAMEYFKEGARILRARGVRHRTGIR